MIPIHKDFSKVPPSLNDTKRKEAFDLNIVEGEYACGDSNYKGKDVKKALDKLYHRKCAFCEKQLFDTQRHVEHYRPKRSRNVSKCDASFGYYWLALCWDNLLLACAECNISKGNCFDISGTRASYDTGTLAKLHTSAPGYFLSEQPLMINPEQEDPTPLLEFTTDGEITSKDKRILYTIKICKLNREELVERRIKILNKTLNRLKEIYYKFQSAPSKEKLEWFSLPLLEFQKETSPDNEFSAWRTYIMKHFKAFLCNTPNIAFNATIELSVKKFLNMA